MFFLNERNGNVGIVTASPGVALDVNGGVRSGSSTMVTACGLGQANGEGIQRYNYTTHAMEYCNGTAWNPIGGGGAGSMVILEQHTATSGTTAELDFTNWYSSLYDEYVIHLPRTSCLETSSCTILARRLRKI
jgi:hypothetical protein